MNNSAAISTLASKEGFASLMLHLGTIKAGLLSQDTVIRRSVENGWTTDRVKYAQMDKEMYEFSDFLTYLQYDSPSTVKAIGGNFYKQCTDAAEAASRVSGRKGHAHGEKLFVPVLDQSYHERYRCSGLANASGNTFLGHYVNPHSPIMLLFDSEEPTETTKVALHCPDCLCKAYDSKNWIGHTMLPNTRRVRYCLMQESSSGEIQYNQEKPDFILPQEDTSMDYDGIDDSVAAALRSYCFVQPTNE